MKTRKNLFMMISIVFLFMLGVSGFGPTTVFATDDHQSNPNRVKPGEFVVEPPTLISLGFEWYIEGDENLNATVEVWYRKKGENNWRRGLNLFRLNQEQMQPWALTAPFGFTGTGIYTAPNMFAGSIFDLEPDTEYECYFVMSDPDGVRGEAHKYAKVRTRPEPKPYAHGNVYHVYPPGYTGPMQQPAFNGLLNAYYTGAVGGDFTSFFPPRVQPGDTILVHAGLYIGYRFQYANELLSGWKQGDYTWNGVGTYFLTQSGTPEKPIVIKAAGDGEVIFDGNGNFNLFNVMGADYNYFEGITIRNTDIAILAGLKKIAGSSGLTVKKCRFENVGKGIHDDWQGSKNFYIADNVFIGRMDPNKLSPSSFGSTPTLSEYAVKVYGSGHVVCYNSVANFHDGIDHATIGFPDGYPNVIRDRMPVSNDFYNNDISNTEDNCLEADGSMFNMRVFRNRCFNSAGGALSLQTSYGGPAYFIRNIIYHGTGGALKTLNQPMGALLFHNTFCSMVSGAIASNEHFLNNLILGEFPSQPIFSLDTFTNYSTSDFNGFRPNAGAAYSFAWDSPPFTVEADYVNPVIVRRFNTLTDYSQATGQDEHSILVDYNIFLNVTPADPTDRTRVYDPQGFDFQLKPNAVAVDAGCILPNINDGFTGNAPDLGAYEVGLPVPHYGPRP
jgi:hypothetical protein